MNWDELMERVQGHRHTEHDMAVPPTPISAAMREHTAVTGQ